MAIFGLLFQNVENFSDVQQMSVKTCQYIIEKPSMNWERIGCKTSFIDDWDIKGAFVKYELHH